MLLISFLNCAFPRTVQLQLERSTNLSTWTAIAVGDSAVTADGLINSLSSATNDFYRLRIKVADAPNALVQVVGGNFESYERFWHVGVKTFYLGKHEVTWAEWKAVRSYASAHGYDIGDVGAGQGEDHPVHSVSWCDIAKWCNAKSEMEGLAPAYKLESGQVYRTGEYFGGDQSRVKLDALANGYRLPTEPEWEWAALGGVLSQRYTYSGSNNLEDVAWWQGNSGGSTHPVGTKSPNEIGLFDMSGNVYEWIWEFNWDADRLRVKPRGGSYSDGAISSEVANDDWDYPDFRNTRTGFRVVRSSL